MSKENNTNTYQSIGQELQATHHISLGQMFGKPCMKTPGGKAFVAFFQGAMVFKLGKEEVDLLKQKYTGSVNWDPSGKGRAMKDWIQIPSEFNSEYSALSIAALQFVEGSDN